MDNLSLVPEPTPIHNTQLQYTIHNQLQYTIHNSNTQYTIHNTQFTGTATTTSNLYQLTNSHHNNYFYIKFVPKATVPM